ncbi:hypothetical protein ABT354_32535 [Streptomyces sp. NPDC000594]|uniref:hypothetical protein n=1 Tax=Streptomyces sp. NPDC000594 TaxID=3154261 RepID=UPI003318BB88
MNSRITHLSAQFYAVGGAELAPVATVYIDRLQDVLDHCVYTERVERALHSAISNLYSLAGWGALDGADRERATLLFSACLKSCLLAGDPIAMAGAWSALGHKALGDHDRAAAATEQALVLLPPRMKRNRAYYTVQLAEIQLAQHDHEAAAAGVAQLSTGLPDMKNLGDRLSRVRRALAA